MKYFYGLVILVYLSALWYVSSRYVAPRAAEPTGVPRAYRATRLLHLNHRLLEEDLSAEALPKSAAMWLPPKTGLAGKYLRKEVPSGLPVEPGDLADVPSITIASGMRAELISLSVTEVALFNAGSSVDIVESGASAGIPGSILGVVCESRSRANCSALVEMPADKWPKDPKSCHLRLSSDEPHNKGVNP